jgi:hypothetical protein
MATAVAAMTNAKLVCGWINCGATFDTVTLLGAHLSETHVKEQKHQNKKAKLSGYHCHWVGCLRPGRPFKGCYNLEHHLRYQHTKEKPFVCTREGCTSSFSQKSDLKEHLRKKHKEDVPKDNKRQRQRSSDSPTHPPHGPTERPVLKDDAPAAASSSHANPDASDFLTFPPVSVDPMFAPQCNNHMEDEDLGFDVEPQLKKQRDMKEDEFDSQLFHFPPILDQSLFLEEQLFNLQHAQSSLQTKLCTPIAGLVPESLLMILQDPSALFVLPAARPTHTQPTDQTFLLL